MNNKSKTLSPKEALPVLLKVKQSLQDGYAELVLYRADDLATLNARRAMADAMYELDKAHALLARATRSYRAQG